MAIGKISKRSVDALAATARDEYLWDSELKGFGLKVTPRGSRSYLVQYKAPGTDRTRRVHLGTHGVLTPETARRRAEATLLTIRSGQDPREEHVRKREVARTSGFADVLNRYLDHAETALRPKTAANVKANLRRFALPMLGNRPLPDLTRADIWTIIEAVPSEHQALRRSVFAHLRAMLGWAVERGDLLHSPMVGLRPPAAVASRERVLTDFEVAGIWRGAAVLGYPFGPMYHLLLLTGQRRNEVAGLTWDELDRSRAEWLLPAARSKNARSNIVPLSRSALAVLDGIAGGQRWPSSGHVFSTTGRSAVSGFSRVKRTLDGWLHRNGSSSKSWRTHDIRRTVATGLQRLAIRTEVTEALLNHVGASRSGVAGVYQRHDWADDKREAVQKWDDHVQIALREPIAGAGK